MRSDSVATLLLAALLSVAGCAGGAGGVPTREATDAAASAGVSVAPPSTLTRVRPLPGAGAAAFDPSAAALAWIDGNRLQLLDLAGGDLRTIELDAAASDLGYTPRGDLWIVAGHVERFHAGASACRSREGDLQRLLGIDAEGISAAGWSYSDGIGPVRHQVWFDHACRALRESDSPLPAGMGDSDADPGEPPLRATLRPPHELWSWPRLHVDGDQLRIDGELPLALPAVPVAASRDGRWWVFGDAGRRALWRLDRAPEGPR